MLEALCMGTPVVGWAPQVEELEAVLAQPVGEGLASDTSAGGLAGEHSARHRSGEPQGVAVEEIARRRARLFSIEQAGMATLRLYREAQAGTP